MEFQQGMLRCLKIYPADAKIRPNVIVVWGD